MAEDGVMPEKEKKPELTEEEQKIAEEQERLFLEFCVRKNVDPKTDQLDSTLYGEFCETPEMKELLRRKYRR